MRRWLVVAAVVAFVYALVGLFAAPPLLRSVLAAKLTKALHRSTTVEGVSVNPFALSVRVRGLTVHEPASDAVFASLGELYANFKVTSIVRLAPVVSELRLADLHVHLVRNADSTYNFSDLVAPAPPTAEPSKPLRYALNNIQLSGGSIELDDRPMGKVHRVDELYLAIPFLSNLPDETNIFVQPALRAVVNGTRLDLKGRTKPFASSRETSLDFEFKDLDVPRYLAYLPARLPVGVRSALLSSRLTLAFRQERDKPSALALSGRVMLRDVRLADRRGDDLLGLRLLDVRISEADLLTGRTDLASVLLQQPTLRVARNAEGELNLATLAPASTGAGEPAAAKDGGTALKVGSFRVADGTVEVFDAAVTPAFTATLRPVELGVEGFGTAPGTEASLHLSVTSDAGETLHETGELTWAPPAAAHGTLEVAGVPLRRYAPYYRDAVAFDVADGVLGLSTKFSWSGGDGWTLSDLAATLRSLRLQGEGESGDFLTVPEATLADSAIDLDARSAALGDLSLTGARLVLTRDRAGAWNLASLLPAPATASEAVAPGGEGASTGWTIGLRGLSLGRAVVEIDDALPAQPVRIVLAPFSLTARDLSTAPGVRGRIEARCAVNGSGTLSLTGDVGLEPLTATLKADIRDVPLVPLQGYVTDHLRLVVNDGTASAAGELTVGGGSAVPSAGFTGQASVDHLATVDADAARDLVRWDALAFHGVSFASEPFRLAIAEIALSGLATHIVVAPDGTANLKRALGLTSTAPAAEGDAEEAGPAQVAEVTPPPAATLQPTAVAPGAESGAAIRIDKVTLSGGAVVLVDRSVSPAVRIDVAGLGGSVSGLSSLASTAAAVDLHATLNGEAPLAVTGKVNPLAGNLFLDLKVVGRDFDMPAVSPYSGVYAGYTIERGKLDVDLAYKVDDRHLQADNSLVLDQFDFGQKVESPKATHLPVRLAVSLLKDREGNINLDLPVSGSLDDPKFKVGRIILKMVLNLLAKAATSPFALLGSLFGGSHAQLDTVAFAPGVATLDDGARNSLDILATALYDRPALRLDITGRSDPVADTEGMRERALERAVKREKLDEIVKKGGTARSLDAVVVEPGEYDEYLARAYKHRKFKKPRNFIGIAKKEPPDEMKRLLLASFTPPPDAVRSLAAARAEAVQAYLLQTGKVAGDRLFIVAAAGPPPTGKDKGPATRVDLSLK